MAATRQETDQSNCKMLTIYDAPYDLISNIHSFMALSHGNIDVCLSQPRWS